MGVVLAKDGQSSDGARCALGIGVLDHDVAYQGRRETGQ